MFNYCGVGVKGMLLVAAGLIVGCASSGRHRDVGAPSVSITEPCLPTAVYQSVYEQDTNYKIQAGDELTVSFYLNSEFDTDVIVRPDGKIGLRLVGELDARGLTPNELSLRLDQLYSRELIDPQATVLVKNSPSRVAYVVGQVGHPGAIPLGPQTTALAAIAQAGGITDEANPDAVLLLRRDMCGRASGQQLNIGGVLDQKNDSDNEEDVALLPGDVLVVPRSGIAEFDLAVKQYVKDVIPIQPYLPIL